MSFGLDPALHEFYADRSSDAAALCGLALASSGAVAQGRSLLWVRHAMLDHEQGAPYAPGVDSCGIASSSMILVRLREEVGVLQAAFEGARCTGLGAVVVELWGEARAYDLTASRRLAMAARKSGVPVLMARVAATPAPSAAETRWRVRAMPSRALAANAPGNPAFAMTLLRARNGQEGQHLHLEWDRDARTLVTLPAGGSDGPVIRPAAVSGALGPVSFDRPGAAREHAWRKAG